MDVGRLDVDFGDEEIFLLLVELSPTHQGRGIGSRLIQQLLDRAAVEGKPLALNVLEVNRRAYALYRRLGFTEARRIVDGPAVKIRMVASTEPHPRGDRYQVLALRRQIPAGLVRCGAASQDMSPLGRADDRHGIVSRIDTARADALREP